MLLARIGGVLLLVSAILAKAPSDSSTVCDRYRQSDLIFTGSADTVWVNMLETRKSPIHKRSEKSKRMRFLVREWYKGQRHNYIEVWMTPSDCSLKIDANEMYLIYARMNKDNGRIESNGCMGTVLAANAASDLTYLGAALQGPGRATRISGTAGSQGVNVQAKSGIDTRYAIADANGKFTFDGLQPGDWDLSILGGAPKQVHLAPDSCIAEDLPH